ncbi:MAG: hypothetical protein GYA21_15290 [Myxococcales bacterium]|nr:hypothetical protein [Myxococcales bacterium]
MKRLVHLLWLPALLAAAAAAATISPSPTGDMTGAGRCAECHPSAYAVWQASAHRKANEALPAERRADPRCTQCHGGNQPSQAGVQCETCHGAGLVYAKTHVMKDRELSHLVGLLDPKEDSCRRCHNDTTPAIRPYEHSRMWSAITHGREKARP